MASVDTAAASEKTQAFAHRLVEFADYDKCIKYFTERQIDFDQANIMGWSVLMSVCACGRDDLVGFVVDRTSAVNCATNSNRTTVLHLTAMSKNTRVMEELVATAERKKKLQQVIDQSNAHGDTALMMACVAKNVTAVKLLLDLSASMDAVNVSGLNALMCAARVGEDPRHGAPSVEEMMERSAAIVKVLLENGADVNTAEKSGDNTALHLAVLSENLAAVESLVNNAPDLDVSLRNKADKTALDVVKQLSGVASAQIEDLLNAKWTQQTKEAAQRSARMEKELVEQARKEKEESGRKQPATAAKTGKKKTKKNKKKATILAKTSKIAQVEAYNSDENTEANDSTATKSHDEYVKVEQESAHPSPELEDAGDWQSVNPKKNRRKESVSESAKPAAKSSVKKPHKNAKKSVRAKTKPEATQHQTAREVLLKPSKAAPPTSAVHKAPWITQTASKPTKRPILASPRSQVASEADEEESATFAIPYDVLNAELEIDVEKFLIASSMSDRELEPNDSLSISQVEALQEAHWQAYHYLSEKKIELTRVLEAQRVEAQFALQQELMHIN
ncbi:putative ankyrin repeat protein L93 [Phytophthora citrophthora]|uniref:Ankyrin repeat protein L93 n=1 Tax=Phytophthora citrophthora TaxID=4793 RepID=A0AAD9GZT0_9STRA|nr:putative ankyrin repeat protein L93 [Phytophthora citrophthora]